MRWKQDYPVLIQNARLKSSNALYNTEGVLTRPLSIQDLQQLKKNDNINAAFSTLDSSGYGFFAFFAATVIVFAMF